MPAEEQYFTNEFRVLKLPEKLDIFQISHNQEKYRGTKFDYNACAVAASEYTRVLNHPVASLGTQLIAFPGSILEKFKVVVKHEGLPVDTVVTAGGVSTIASNSPQYVEMSSRFLNRQIDLAMGSSNFRQDGRYFYEKKPTELGRIFRIYRGAYIGAKVHSSTSACVVIDPAFEHRSSQTLLEALNGELKKRGITSWKDISTQANEINRIFKSRAYRLRSVYTEVVGSHSEPEHNAYRFKEFNFTKGAGHELEEARSPISFHKRFGRDVNADQPIVKVYAKGGYEVSHAPELLEIQPSSESIKRVSEQFSKRAKTMALMSSQDRFYSSTDYAKSLVKAGLIAEQPLKVQGQYCGPVVLALEDDYIDVKTNLDFRKFFKKGRLLIKPNINSVHVFHNREDSNVAAPLMKTLAEAMSEFRVPFPNPQVHGDAPEAFDDFAGYVIDRAVKDKLGRHDLVIVIDNMDDPDSDELYYRVKGYSLFDQVFPTQFFRTASIEAQLKDDLKANLVYTVLPQIVAKLGGVPFGLRPGFAPPGSIFVGLDRFRDTFSRQPSTNASVAIFDDRG